MITRTTIGADFEGALTYGAGVRQGDKAKKAELIGSSNLVDVGNPRGLAAEMQAVAEENSKCKNPVWHTSLSWAKDEQLSRAQKLQAAERYCELLRAQLTKSKHLNAEERAVYNVWEQHQVAVYEHKDKDHDHIHIYLNRVPVYGGAALDTGHNYKFNLAAIKTITQELRLHPLPSQRQSFNDSRPPVQETRQVVRAVLVKALADPQVQSIEQLREHLNAQGIEMRTKRSQAGQLVGVSFRYDEAAVTGQEVGMKAAQLREHYEPAQLQVQAQVEQSAAPAEVLAQLLDQGTQPVATDMARESLRQKLAGVLATATSGGTLKEGLKAHGIDWQINKDETGQSVSMSFGFNKGSYLFEGTELHPTYSIAGIGALIKANHLATNQVRQQAEAEQARQGAAQEAAAQAQRQVAAQLAQRQESERQAKQLAERSAAKCQEAQRQAAQAAKVPELPAAESKWQASYPQYLAEVAQQNTPIQVFNKLIDSASEYLETHPNEEGLAVVMRKLAGDPRTAQVQADLARQVKTRADYQQNWESTYGQQAALEKKAEGGFFVSWAASEAAKEKVKYLYDPILPDPDILQADLLKFARAARFAARPAPTVSIEAHTYYRPEVVPLSLAAYAAQREAVMQAQASDQAPRQATGQREAPQSLAPKLKSESPEEEEAPTQKIKGPKHR
jgi:hypothetical protein